MQIETLNEIVWKRKEEQLPKLIPKEGNYDDPFYIVSPKLVDYSCNQVELVIWYNFYLLSNGDKRINLHSASFKGKNLS